MMGTRRLPLRATLPRRIARRRGFNLPELLFVVTAISGLTVLVVTIIGALITAEQHSAENLWIDVTVAALASDLREDAHRALRLQATGDDQARAPSVTLFLPEQTHVTYECVSDGVLRRSYRAGDQQATETYRLALGASTFVLPGEDGLLRWTHRRTIPSIGGLAQPSAEHGGVQRAFHVHTAIGLRAVAAGKENE